MSGGLKLMNTHVKAVKNIKKITTSMKSVAAAKFSKSEKSLRIARPFGISAYHFYELSKLKQELFAPHVTMVAVTSDRGLCGSMHSKVCKEVRLNIRALGHTRDIVCVGEKAKAILQFDLRANISVVVNGVGHKAPTFSDAAKIVTYTFKTEDYKQANIFFPKFKNVVAFEIDQLIIYSLPILLSSRRILPYEIEADDLDSYLEFSQAALMYYALCETFLVELSSRIMTMSNASKNAGAMMQKLQLEMNRKRQQLVTNELLDIVSGAQVISKK